MGVLTPPPGCGLVTTTGKSLAFVSNAAAMVAVMCLASTVLLAIVVPLNDTLLALTKPVPTIWIAVAAALTSTVCGVTDVTVTVGLVTVNAIALDAPPPGAGFTTVTL